MNYLAHFVFNHEVCGLPAEPYFVTGVALPDVWLRFSRRRRIRWSAVRGAAVRTGDEATLRAGLLNHTEVDRYFHTLPLFLNWQQRLLAAAPRTDVHPALLDFLAHVALELALDHHLLRADGGRVEAFYDLIERAAPEHVAHLAATLGDVDTAGLADVLTSFTRRRFIRHYVTVHGMADALQLVLMFARFPMPPRAVIEGLIADAVAVAEPARVWDALPTTAAVFAAAQA